MNADTNYITGLPPGLGNKQLTFAAPHVSGGWFPINPDLFDQIKSRLSAGVYSSKVELLLEDLKGDYALFAYCLKELSRMLANQAPPQGFRPMDLMRAAGVKKIASLFEKPLNEISRHRMTDMDRDHAKQLSSAMTSACTAEILAKNQNIDPDIAFSCALFRQLGIVLIAWNYPHVYKRVVSSPGSRKDLDSALSRMLGFSPTLLGITLAREWGLSPEIRYVMGEKSIAAQDTLNGTQLKEALILEKLCTIGETLAQMNDFENSPGSGAEWSKARNEILRQIGSKGLAEINDRLGKICKHYIGFLGETFNLPVSKKLMQDSSAQHVESLIQSNTYIQFLNPELQNDFRAFYDQIKPGAISKESIDFLFNKIVPKIGFDRGCIYLIDPGMSSLMPRLAVGNASLNQFHPSNYLASDTRSDPILLAFRSSSPVLEKCITLEGPKLRYITGAIGKTQRGGVLYLEPGDKLRNEEESKILLLFKALLQAVADSLTLA